MKSIRLMSKFKYYYQRTLTLGERFAVGVQLVSRLTRLDLTKEENMLLLVGMLNPYLLARLETSCTVILPLPNGECSLLLSTVGQTTVGEFARLKRDIPF